MKHENNRQSKIEFNGVALTVTQDDADYFIVTLQNGTGVGYFSLENKITDDYCFSPTVAKSLREVMTLIDVAKKALGFYMMSAFSFKANGWNGTTSNKVYVASPVPSAQKIMTTV